MMYCLHVRKHIKDGGGAPETVITQGFTNI